MGRKYASFGGLAKAGLVFGIAAIVLAYKVSKRRLEAGQAWLGLFFAGSLFFALARFDFVHLQPALPFAILLITLAAKELATQRPRLLGFSYILAVFVVVFPFYRTHLGNRVVFFGDFEKKLADKVYDYAKEGEVVFAMGTTPHLYQLTKTLPPGNVFVFQFPWFMVEAEDKILAGLVSDKPRVVARDLGAATGGVNLTQYMPKINKFVNENYKIVDKVESTEIMVPK